MAEQKQNMYMMILNADRIGFANDDEVDDKKMGKSVSKVAKKAVKDVFCYPKHKTLETKQESEKFWKDLSTGECVFYEEEKNLPGGTLFNDIKDYINKYGQNEKEKVVLVISGKYSGWLAELPSFEHVVIILAGGGFNPKDLTDDEMIEISVKHGSQARFYIDHNHQVNLDVENYNRLRPKGSPKLPVFRAIENDVLVKFDAEKVWEKFLTIPELANTLMDFVFTDNWSSDELAKVGTTEKFTDKLRKLKGFDEKDVESARKTIDHMYTCLPPVTREDIQRKTPAWMRFQGAFCLARQVTRMLLDDMWSDHLWYSKFFSLRSGLAELLLDGKPSMPWGDCAIGVAASEKYNHMFVPDRRDFKRNTQGYVSALPCGDEPVGNFYTLVFRPDLPLPERAALYEEICMDWWTDLIMNW